jgi:hypothetical protein
MQAGLQRKFIQMIYIEQVALLKKKTFLENKSLYSPISILDHAHKTFKPNYKVFLKHYFVLKIVSLLFWSVVVFFFRKFYKLV